MNFGFPLIIGLAVVASLFLSSCNTFVGMGRDFQRLGQGFENAAYGKKF